jgi:hypothetical protein
MTDAAIGQELPRGSHGFHMCFNAEVLNAAGIGPRDDQIDFTLINELISPSNLIATPSNKCNLLI